MNAHALLTSQGWRGTGHSLHPTSDTTGLSRPLLVSSKNNNLGIGKKQHKTSDMWWMNAFDKSLKGLDTSVEGQVTQTVTSGGLDMVVKGGAKFVGNKGGLYASFVRGEVLGGTLQEEKFEVKAVEVPVVEERRSKKRKLSDVVEESKEQRRTRKAAKRAAKAEEASHTPDKETSRISSKIETNEECKLRGALKKARKEGKSERKKHSKIADSDKEESKEERRARRAVRTAQKLVSAASIPTPPGEDSERAESKEERTARRLAKKLSKTAKDNIDETIPKESKRKRRKE
ncbi:hypothetical protein BJ878DRAFT_540977 [Calycina marina]|uniref:Uncharacterized protein n=1 Tax=Calycina marina TaxID=1763456 RepID=A0A9P8CGH4_9HELO|nr:hypothetical protein BJ878DRAFT_540977 [Calycina marina]